MGTEETLCSCWMDVRLIFSDYFLDECTYNGVFPFQEPAGSSDQVQALDLGIFARQKALKNTIVPPASVKGATEMEIVRIVDSWREATSTKNVISAFSQAGIYRTVAGGKVIMTADIKYARAVRGMPHETAPECDFYTSNKKIQTF